MFSLLLSSPRVIIIIFLLQTEFSFSLVDLGRCFLQCVGHFFRIIIFEILFGKGTFALFLSFRVNNSNTTKEFHWVGISENRSNSDRLKRIIAQFTPFRYVRFATFRFPNFLVLHLSIGTYFPLLAGGMGS